MGIAQKAMKMNSMAITSYKEAIRLDPKMADAYTNLGNLYIEMNNLTQAIRLLQDGISKCPASKKLPAVLQKAREKKEGVQVEEAPLGRLVDEKELQKKQIRTAPRKLDAAGRVHERETLHGIGKTLRHCTRPIVEMLNGPLQQQIHKLDLAAAMNDSRGEAPGAYDAMRQTLEEIDGFREITQRAISEIRAELEKTDPGLT